MGVQNVTKENMQRLADAQNPDRKPTDPPELPPNRIQLYSFYKPGLLAGNYRIEAEQNIESRKTVSGEVKTENLRIYNRKKAATNVIDPQEFEVIAPQFSLDPKLIDSFYPPEGHQDEGRILPHLVLKDVHFPWERMADASIPLLWDPDKNAQNQFLGKDGNVVEKEKSAAKRNAVPWVALMVFDVNELAPLTREDIKASDLNLDSMFPIIKGPPGTPDKDTLDEQANTGAVPMTVQQFFSIPSTSRVNFEAGLAQDKDSKKDLEILAKSQEKMTAIFPTKAKFKALFPDIPSLRYSAHVRNVNTTGFPDAGIDQMGLYSIIVSSRVGKYDSEVPVTQICHLVSLEHLESTKKNLDDGEGRIALISLLNWTYTALPPDPVNFVDSIRKVLKELQMLRPNDGVLDTLSKRAADPAERESAGLGALHDRLSAGYSLARWRCETGEETVAFNRGPLVPQKVPKPPADWATSSNTSKEYQILDPKTGIMDLSYSSAWQLGKLLAISDTTFSQALSRLRSTIQRASQSKTRAEVNAVASKQSLIEALKNDIGTVEVLSSGNVSEPQRVTAPAQDKLPPALDDPSVVPIFDKNVSDAVLSAGSVTTKAADGKLLQEIYTGFNRGKHNNTDWTIVHTWISEKLYLSNIPAHVLIPDPTFLPTESIRFFHIDDNWLDCLIDGALSVGNHLERDDDRIRQFIKQTYNQFLLDKSLGIRTQIPAYGFYLRSKIVKVMPDLKITIKWKTEDERFPFCRYTRPEDQTIMCLLDRQPEELEYIELSQPTHQQRFSFGHAYKAGGGFEFVLRHLFTNGEETMEKWGSIEDSRFQPDVNKVKSWFFEDTLAPVRVLNLGKMAKDINQTIRDSAETGTYVDCVATSAELALELNDPAYYFKIEPPTGTITGEISERNRQLWCAKVVPTTESTIGNQKPNLKDSKHIGGTIPPKIPGSTLPIQPTTGGPPNKSNHIVVRQTTATPAEPGTIQPSALPLQCFNVKVYADYKGLSPPPDVGGNFDPKDYIPTGNMYLYDLIFSVRRKPGREKAGYSLREIIINVPTSGIDVKSPIEPLINAGSNPKVRMLSNQRFVPFLNWTDQYLQIRLVPRSAKEHPVIKIQDMRTNEISFRLQEVDVYPIRNKAPVPIKGDRMRQMLGNVKVQVYERYETPAGVRSAAGSPQSVTVIKRDIADIVDYGKS